MVSMRQMNASTVESTVCFQIVYSRGMTSSATSNCILMNPRTNLDLVIVENLKLESKFHICIIELKHCRSFKLSVKYYLLVFKLLRGAVTIRDCGHKLTANTIWSLVLYDDIQGVSKKTQPLNILTYSYCS